MLANQLKVEPLSSIFIWFNMVKVSRGKVVELSGVLEVFFTFSQCGRV